MRADKASDSPPARIQARDAASTDRASSSGASCRELRDCMGFLWWAGGRRHRYSASALPALLHSCHPLYASVVNLLQDQYVLVKMEELQRTHAELQERMADPSVSGNNTEYQKLAKAVFEIQVCIEARACMPQQLLMRVMLLQQ